MERRVAKFCRNLNYIDLYLREKCEELDRSWKLDHNGYKIIGYKLTSMRAKFFNRVVVPALQGRVIQIAFKDYNDNYHPTIHVGIDENDFTWMWAHLTQAHFSNWVSRDLYEFLSHRFWDEFDGVNDVPSR
jgi:hypothetical protein